MKASELIKHLQTAIDRCGDKEVYDSDSEVQSVAFYSDSIQLSPWPMNREHFREFGGDVIVSAEVE